MPFGASMRVRAIIASHNLPEHEHDGRSMEALGESGAMPTWSRVRSENAAMISRVRAE